MSVDLLHSYLHELRQTIMLSMSELLHISLFHPFNGFEFFFTDTCSNYLYHRRMGHEFRFLFPPSFLYYPPFFKIFIIIRFFSFDNISRRHTDTSWIIRVFCVQKLWTQNTRIIHDVWRLLILSNGEKRMIMNILIKGMNYIKILKKGGKRKRNPCPMRLWSI